MLQSLSYLACVPSRQEFPRISKFPSSLDTRYYYQISNFFMKGHYLYTCFTAGYTYTWWILRAGTTRIHPTFPSCTLKVPLKCSRVTYLAIVPNNLLRSELLTTSEWVYVLWPLTSSLGFLSITLLVSFLSFIFFNYHRDFFFQSHVSHFWAVSLGQEYLPFLSCLLCNLLALTIGFILKNIALEKSVLKPSSNSDYFCL